MEPEAEPPASNTPLRTNPSSTPTENDVNFMTLLAQEDSTKQCFMVRGLSSVLVVDHTTNDCYFLKWKTYSKMQRKGRELDPRYFDKAERDAFAAADAKEWQSFIDTGAVKILSPQEAAKIPESRILSRRMRYVRTDRAEDD